MKYSVLASLYERLEKTSKKLEKRDILADFYKKAEDDLYHIVLLSEGVVFPQKGYDLGIAREMMKRTISKTSGASDKEITKKFKELGDLGLVAEHFLRNRRQTTLSRKELTVRNVFGNLRALPGETGTGSHERKMSLITELLGQAIGIEARYIVRTVLGDMRIGVAGGIVRDAIAKAFDKDPKQIEKIYDIVGDFGKVAEQAKAGKLEARMEVFLPIRVMLADRAKDLKDAMDSFEKRAIETKYDGFRIQCHKDGNEVRIFSRRMEDVTLQFPDIVAMAKERINAKTCIVEGEAVAIRDGKPQPFQLLSRRIQRKYDIEKTVKEIPVHVFIYELIFYGNESWMLRPLKDRWKKLKEIIKISDDFRLADHIETDDIHEAEKFYKDAISAGQEGVIVKNTEAYYQPGKRVGYWLKVKDILEPLDLVITGAEWGEGKRARWLGSLILAARAGSAFRETGRMASGLTEEQLADITRKLRPLIEKEEGKIVKVKPSIVVEIGYEEIQKSPKYASGYALRFPRLLRFRDEKTPEDADTVKTIEKLFRQQRGRNERKE